MHVRLCRKFALISALFSSLAVMSVPVPSAKDPYRWLEDVDDARSMNWVKRENAITAKRLGSKAEYAGLYKDAMAALTSDSRIPGISQHGQYVYNLWQDQAHPRGIFRRTTLDEYRKTEPAWETLLDIDALSKAEGKKWAFGGAHFAEDDLSRCLIELAPGGGDAAEIREFDVDQRSFVEGGFRIAEAKTRLSWRDKNTLLVSTDVGKDSLTTSGYPRIVKVWQRGTPLAQAQTLYTGAVESVSAYASHIDMPDYAPIELITEEHDYWHVDYTQLVEGKLHKLDLPGSVRMAGAYAGKLVLWLREDWQFKGKTWPAGAVLLADPASLRGGEGEPELVVAQSAHLIVEDVRATAKGLLISALDDVKGRFYRYTPSASGWQATQIAFPDMGALTIADVDERTGDALVEFQTFLTPPTLYRVSASSTTPEQLKAQAPTFDGSQFEVQQQWTTSADGTRVPYFLVGKKGMQLNGKQPVWMFSYGGFENSLRPSYSGSYEDMHGAYGKLWLERGGVFVLANIRGGGEFGPGWHLSAIKQHHVKSFEDFEAVAADLVRRGITSPRHIGIEGRSNGGLLVTATMMRHPELYGAVVCGNPLIDMQRYSHLLAGASWIGEYGDPDKAEDWAYISQYSPYQKVKAGLKLPPVMFYSTTRDDRVHPGHARKMAAKMKAAGYPVEYFENIEGGHHGPVVTEQLATRVARTFTFLWQTIGAGR
ncbi:prolyl oligopeptidase family serine peptidase [Burkholderiaceae bacterium DAT-1]|nr:prolyl oligopeptidase family serine peptidase [Burkholderiaceae bacterium DAT-1]